MKFYSLKKLKYFLFLFLFSKFLFALNTGSVPSTISGNTNAFESTIAWGLKIGGIIAVAYACVTIARNKAQGQAIDTIVMVILGLGAALFGIGWWYGQQSSVQGFLF